MTRSICRRGRSARWGSSRRCGAGISRSPDTGSRSEGVTGFFWTLREFCERGYLGFMFVDADTEQTQIAALVDTVSGHLRIEARKSPEGKVSIDGVEVTDVR